jgi:predicted PurR-regulated permease PerM
MSWLSELAEPGPEPDVTARPTPIWISRRTRNLLLLAAVVLAVLIVWKVPAVLVTLLGGIALALVLSFPVGWLSGLMPRGFAILLSFLAVMGLIVLAVVFLLPVLVEQFTALVRAIPEIAAAADRNARAALAWLDRRELLPAEPDEVVAMLERDFTTGARALAGTVVGGALGVLTGTFSFALTLFGVIFVGAYLLADVRRIRAAYLRAVPRTHRRDARTLWNAFGYSLSRYLAGLALVLFIQGAASALALWAIGVPYALVLGAWVSVTAVIPFLGSFLGGIPAVIVAFTISPTTALLTVLLFVAIQQLEGNVLTPRIQGEALRVHPILVFLAVIAGGGLAGILGVLFAVPVLAVLRVLLDFLRVRLRTGG